MKLVYAGSFDPVTRGHLDLIDRGSQLCEELLVAVGTHRGKQPLFSVEERLGFLKDEVGRLGQTNIRIAPFDGLAVELVREQGFDALLRGIRTVSDLEYEQSMALTNRTLAPDVDTVFLMPSPELLFTSSSLVKEALSMGARVGQWLTPAVEEALRQRLKEGKSNAS